MPCEVTDEIVQDVPALADLLSETAKFLWKDWPKQMIAVYHDNNVFTLCGICPHCYRDSVFTIATGIGVENLGSPSNPTYRTVAGMKCQGCKNYILGIVNRTQGDMFQYIYQAHYPLGKPNDKVSDDIPAAIAEDFQEALRCRWVDAYNATVEMCRRALESSCLQLGADPKLGTLEKMIDWVHTQGKITTPLREMAHKIRLGGDRGAHPSTRTMGQEDADAVIEFTREYFDHVYVMPARMAKFDFSRPKPEKSEAP